MSIPFLLGLLGIFLLVPGRNFEIYRLAWQWEHAQIAADNAAIRWGKGDREALRFVEASNRMLSAMDAAHHVLHGCARIPESMAACLPKDLAIEKEIQVLHAVAGKTARMLWRNSTLNGLAALSQMRIRRLERQEHAPITERVCPICGEKVSWVPHPEEARVELFSQQPIRAGRKLLEERKWNYILTAGE